MSHSLFFSLADNLQTARTKIKYLNCSSRLGYTWNVTFVKKISRKSCYFWHQTLDSWKGIAFTVENRLTLSEDEILVKCFRLLGLLVLHVGNLFHQECSNNYSGRISTAPDLQRHPVVSYSCQLAHYSSMNDEGSVSNFICKLNVSC